MIHLAMAETDGRTTTTTHSSRALADLAACTAIEQHGADVARVEDLDGRPMSVWRRTHDGRARCVAAAPQDTTADRPRLGRTEETPAS